MEELTDRQKILLTLITHEHINSAIPVGSKMLVERYNVGLSSATVRNEMAVLTDLGYLRQPHTSAGRVPTEKGYRFFVGRLVNEREIPLSTRRTITHQFYQMRNDVEQWVKLAGSILADQSKAASLITAPHPTLARLKHVEFIATRGRQVLMVLVLMGGEIRQSIQTLSEYVGQDRLSQIANRIIENFQGFDVDKISYIKDVDNNLEHDLIDWVVNELERADSLVSGELFLDGITNVMAEPEFNDSEEARKTLKVFGERSMLQDVIARSIQNGDEGSVQVLIGGDGSWEELKQCSIVLSKYGAPGVAFGTVGVLGPVRMPYGQTISAVRFMSGILSDLVSETLYDDQFKSS
ncbi:MAG: heat-inducible transcription repressor HrcA [Chloroflexi bacterium HGW-Chloroflexi-2]|jgi:heat-inducible transcriptional repressor|nr:MAG: heat-inducible transcription repressor HrcA [Chloroflexi bacterium HGW-Chloroflexi-2]